MSFLSIAKGQDSIKIDRFQLKIRQLNGKVELVSESISSPGEYRSITQKELARWQNNGYPFAILQIDTISYPDQRPKIVATLDAGPLISNGNLINHGDTTINLKFLRRALRFRVDQPFSTLRFNRTPTMLSQMEFFEPTQRPYLEWFGSKAILHVSLQKRKLNTFSGILGILPQSDGKTIVTGNIDLGLVNLFNQGIGLKLLWTRFAPSSQTADIRTAFPAIGYNGLGLESNFNFFRQDSLLTKQRFDIQTISSLSGLWKFRVGLVVARASSNIVSSDTSFQKIHSNALTFNISWDSPVATGIVFDKRSFSLSAFPSIKNISRISGSDQLPQLESNFKAFYFIPGGVKRFGIQLSSQGSAVWSQTITVADQSRMGGYKTIRGFNENFFFTSQNVLLSVQPQFLLDKNLLFGIFSDAMLYNSQLNMKGFANPDLAISVGMAVELMLSKNLVQISFANGTAPGLPFDFQATKIHFGYVATF